jgi:hypothetical protein
MKIQTANQVSGRAIGALFFAGFGAIWLGLAFYCMERLSVAVGCGILLGLAGVVLVALSLFRTSKRFPREPDDPAVSNTFKWVNIVQWIAVGVVAFTLNRLSLDAYVLSAITVIVGLHMFPLARLFHYSPHYVTGAVLVGWGVASAVLVPVSQMQGVTALGTGGTLWLSAAVTLALAWQGARQSRATQLC